MKLVIVTICVRIENFKSISMHVFIQNLLQEKDGVYLQDKKYIVAILSCNILVKYFLQTAKKVKQELNSIVIQHALI